MVAAPRRHLMLMFAVFRAAFLGLPGGSELPPGLLAACFGGVFLRFARDVQARVREFDDGALSGLRHLMTHFYRSGPAYGKDSFSPCGHDLA